LEDVSLIKKLAISSFKEHHGTGAQIPQHVVEFLWEMKEKLKSIEGRVCKNACMAFICFEPPVVKAIN
jgi:hypothetical protein